MGRAYTLQDVYKRQCKGNPLSLFVDAQDDKLPGLCLLCNGGRINLHEHYLRVEHALL